MPFIDDRPEGTELLMPRRAESNLPSSPGPRKFVATLLVVLALVSASALFAGDVPTWCDENGEGEPTIVLIHGIGADRSVWDPAMPGLTQRHRVVRVDLPGHGVSPEIGSVSVREVARVVDRALEHLHVERAVLVGHSYGGWVALEEAVAHPKRAAAVVVIDMGAYTPRDSMRTAALEKHMNDRYTQLIGVIFQEMSLDPAESDSAVARALRVPRPVVTAYFRDAWRTDLRERIRKLRVPVHVIATTATWPPTQPWDRVKTALGYQTSGPVEGHRVTATGHLVMRDRPDTLDTIIDQIAGTVPKR